MSPETPETGTQQLKSRAGRTTLPVGAAVAAVALSMSLALLSCGAAVAALRELRELREEVALLRLGSPVSCGEGAERVEMRGGALGLKRDGKLEAYGEAGGATIRRSMKSVTAGANSISHTGAGAAAFTVQSTSGASSTGFFIYERYFVPMPESFSVRGVGK